MSAFATCRTTFETLGEPFTLTDMTAATVATYHSNRTDSLKTYFPDDTVEMLVDKTRTSVEGSVAVSFFVARFPKRRAIVAGVRGSFSRNDWIVNIATSIESIALSVGFSSIPFFPARMDAVIATYVEIAASMKFGVTLYAPLVRSDLERVAAEYPDHRLYIVGHSAGGAVAGLVAAISDKGVRAVTLSAVGMGLQYKRFDFDLDEAHNRIFNLVPRGDVVPKIDVLLGTTQHFTMLEPCSSSNAFCHSSTLSLKTITTQCGDPLGRGSASEADAALLKCYAKTLT
jgi:hypothetical protein